MRKHAVICNMGEGDDIKLVAVHNDAITAIQHAKRMIREICDDISFQDGGDTFVPQVDEKYQLSESTDGEYEYTITTVANEFIVHPVDL